MRATIDQNCLIFKILAAKVPSKHFTSKFVRNVMHFFY